jgi:glycosyltransferase involved in cell wall biosynthesis
VPEASAVTGSTKLQQLPLVTVGIPTFNRPIGLNRTLTCILNQTYTNLEVLVSDNCSTNSEVNAILNDHSRDARVKVFIQAMNLGAFNNFKFLLRESSGLYFMWAADDDEWEPDFIEKCMINIGIQSGAFCSMKVLYRQTGEVSFQKAKPLGSGAYLQAHSFIKNLNSSMFYAVHRRQDIIWWAAAEYPPFDWVDCHIVLKSMLHGEGFAMLADDYLYTMGVDDKEYVFKPTNPQPGRLFQYYPLLSKCLWLIVSSRRVKLVQKIALAVDLSLAMIRLFENYEQIRWNYSATMFVFSVYRSCILFVRRLIGRIRKVVGSKIA